MWWWRFRVLGVWLILLGGMFNTGQTADAAQKRAYLADGALRLSDLPAGWQGKNACQYDDTGQGGVTDCSIGFDGPGLGVQMTLYSFVWSYSGQTSAAFGFSNSLRGISVPAIRGVTRWFVTPMLGYAYMAYQYDGPDWGAVPSMVSEDIITSWFSSYAVRIKIATYARGQVLKALPQADRDLLVHLTRVVIKRVESYHYLLTVPPWY